MNIHLNFVGFLDRHAPSKMGVSGCFLAPPKPSKKGRSIYNLHSRRLAEKSMYPTGVPGKFHGKACLVKGNQWVFIVP